MANKDKSLINQIINNSNKHVPTFLKEAGIEDGSKLEHPLDRKLIELLEKIDLKPNSDDYAIFQSASIINDIWKKIIEKSIICLRYFDKREPFIKNPTKFPVAYGVSDLGEYFDKYSQFENMLYGGAKYYRDHVIHVFRTWLLGMDCLLKNDSKYLKKINVGEYTNVSSLEKLCIWSIIALTHDLGYPLEKSQEIIDKTKDMMKSFVSNPVVAMDISFSGIQCNMNDYVLRFMSSKMIKKFSEPEENNQEKDTPIAATIEEHKPYVARLQPKYYFKFQKSLEKSMHGVISAIIIYKLLIYFLESDYSINEDYLFSEEDARQFYIRREILRSISAHTCKDIYHLDMLSFSYLLIIADDCQEWGRKRITELYVGSNTKYEFGDIQTQFDTEKIEVNGKEVKVHKCQTNEEFTIPAEDKSGLRRVISDLFKQFENYKTIFRDGQDTSKRNFSFLKKSTVVWDGPSKVKFEIEFNVSNSVDSKFVLEVGKCGTTDIDEDFGSKFIDEIFPKTTFKSDVKEQKTSKTIYSIVSLSHV